jgi:tetratricopeptide (TPR) repeat protein
VALDAARILPNSPSVYFELGVALHDRGRLEEALAALREAARRDGDRIGWAALRVGVVLRELGRHEEAIETYRTILRRQPSEDTARFHLAETLRRAGRPDEAAAVSRAMIADLRQAIARRPDDTRLRHNLALSLLLVGDREGYRRACAAVLEHFSPPESVSSSDVARACLLTPDAVPDLRAALRLAEIAAAKPPAYAWTYYTLALAHLRAGQFDAAIRRARQSMELDPNWHATALNRVVLALAHARLDHAAEARRWLETTRRDPDRPSPGGRPVEALGLTADWWDWADVLLLRREAEELLEREPPELPSDAFAHPATDPASAP